MRKGSWGTTIMLVAVLLAVLSLGLLFQGCSKMDEETDRKYDTVVISKNQGSTLVEYTSGSRAVVLNPYPELEVGDKVDVKNQGYSVDGIVEIISDTSDC